MPLLLFVCLQHLFREPEKCPPAVVSTVFTGLVLAPLGLLLVVVSLTLQLVWVHTPVSTAVLHHLSLLSIQWLGMGANLSNVTTNGPWALVFQLGLVGELCYQHFYCCECLGQLVLLSPSAIFGLYYCF